MVSGTLKDSCVLGLTPIINFHCRAIDDVSAALVDASAKKVVFPMLIICRLRVVGQKRRAGSERVARIKFRQTASVMILTTGFINSSRQNNFPASAEAGTTGHVALNFDHDDGCL